MVRFGAGTSRGSAAPGTRLARPAGGITSQEPGQQLGERAEMGDATEILFLHTSIYLYLFNAVLRERE